MFVVYMSFGCVCVCVVFKQILLVSPLKTLSILVGFLFFVFLFCLFVVVVFVFLFYILL